MPRILLLDPRPRDFEIPAGVERSRTRGALRLLPGVPRDVTAGELEALRKTGARVEVFASTPSNPLPAPETAPSAPAPAEEASETPVRASAPSRGKRRRRVG